MAIEYDFYLSSGLHPALAVEVLLGRFPELAWSEDKTFLVGPTMRAGAMELSKSRQETINEGYGFVPTLSVWFRRAFDAEPNRFAELLLESTLVLLEHTQDAVLLVNEEITVMQRLGGQIAFNAETNPGRDEAWLRSRFPLPFECRPLRSPLVEG